LGFLRFTRWIKETGTVITLSLPLTHKPSSVAELLGYIIIQGARTLMILATEAPAYL
jgi:hypothetical protein